MPRSSLSFWHALARRALVRPPPAVAPTTDLAAYRAAKALRPHGCSRPLGCQRPASERASERAPYRPHLTILRAEERA